LRSQPVHNEREEIIGAAASFDLQSLLYRMAPMLVPADARCSLNERTGVPDHEFTIAYVQAKLKRFAGHNLPFAILRIELDGLGELLARHGVDAAHAMLLPLANTLKNTLRPSDYLGVWGEYQFVAVMNSMSGASPDELAHRLRRIAATASIQWWGDRLAPAIRVESTTARAGDTMETLLERVHANETPGA
jgi:GGDEF domain-containing protein